MIQQFAADTAMGAVTLNVADLDAMTAYYRDGVGLDVLSADGGRRGRSGDRSREIVILVQTPELRHAAPHEAGLFHTAIVFDTEAALAAAVYSVARMRPGSFTGSSDHLVSKAFYFDDPEGNGVELYWDRDRSAWSWTHGQIEMSTLFLDPNAFLQEHLTEQGIEGRRMGRRPGRSRAPLGRRRRVGARVLRRSTRLGCDDRDARPGPVRQRRASTTTTWR